MKLALGTVQLGLHYGLTNSSGKPSRKDALSIIHYAIQHGIDVLDTASAYGASEAIIGEYLSSHKSENVRVVTKIPKINEAVSTYEDLYTIINKYVQQSLDNLKTVSLDCCLLHDCMNIDSHSGHVIEILNKLKVDGKIKKLGVSVYHPAEVQKVLKTGCFDIIQVPLNILDQRLIHTGLLKELSDHRIEIHARSAYLQGLLLMNPEELPDYLKMAKKPLEQFHLLSKELNLSREQLALLFVRDINEVDKVIVGCETRSQLKENIHIFNLPPLEMDILNLVKGIFSDVPEIIINPSLWRKTDE